MEDKKRVFNLENAIGKLAWRLQNGNFTPNQNDLEALKFIGDWVNRQKNQTKIDHLAFVKLYAMHLHRVMLKYPSVSLANKEIARELDLSSEYHYERLRMLANAIESTDFFRSIGLKPEFEFPETWEDGSIVKQLSPEEMEKQKKILNENKERILLHVEGIWEKEDFYRNLDNQITEALNRFNKPIKPTAND